MAVVLVSLGVLMSILAGKYAGMYFWARVIEFINE